MPTTCSIIHCMNSYRGRRGRRIVVVTGCPRSGTTGVGGILAHAQRARALYEPLNALAGDYRVSDYFLIPGADGFTEESARSLVHSIATLELHLRPGIFGDDVGLRRLGKRLVGGRTKLSYLTARADIRADTLIWKDPFASFWIPFLAENYSDMQFVVTYRPVAAVAASFARLGWSFDVGRIARRSKMRFGNGISPAVEEHLSEEDLRDSALNGAALWALIYDRIVRWKSDPRLRSRIVLVDAAELASAPHEYRSLQRTLRLHGELEGRARAELERKHTGERFGPRAHTKNRDLSQLNSYWRSILARDVSDRITRRFDALDGDVRELIG